MDMHRGGSRGWKMQEVHPHDESADVYDDVSTVFFLSEAL